MAGARSLAPALAVANTDSFLASSLLAQRGQAGVSAARVSFSNSLPQAWQAYSWIGMATLSSVVDGCARGSGPGA